MKNVLEMKFDIKAIHAIYNLIMLIKTLKLI